MAQEQEQEPLTGKRQGSGRSSRRRSAAALMAACLLVLVGVPGSAAPGGDPPDHAGPRVSEFGEYGGYSKVRYDDWVRTSEYVPVRDGTRLAVDIFRPVNKAGKVERRPLPVVWTLTPYQRATRLPDGTLRTVMDGPMAQKLLSHGYVIAAVDARGRGASFGTRDEVSDRMDGLDGYDITEWMAEQPWSDGNIGMHGVSYPGRMALQVAGTAPPHLKAIMPEVSPFDWYDTVHFGGIHQKSMTGFAVFLHNLATNPNTNVPVDEDHDETLLAAALAEHDEGNTYHALVQDGMPFRDSVNPSTGEMNWVERTGDGYTEGFGHVAVYHRTGFFAGVADDQLLWYVNQESDRKKMLIGPWSGGGLRLASENDVWTTEGLRFFDYWLKDVRNGVMEDAPIHYSVASAHVREGSEWRGAWEWPLSEEQRTEFFFHEGPSGSVDSVNDGLLTASAPSEAAGHDDYTVNYDMTYGDDQPALPGETPTDNSGYDALGLTYTTRPLTSDTEVVGHPEINLWVASTADDGDFIVKFSDVDELGRSTFVAQAQLRASRRETETPPYDYLGLPWPTHGIEDEAALPAGHPVELSFTSLRGIFGYKFREGHRIRVTIAGADQALNSPTEVDPPPTVTIYRNEQFRSSVTLPLLTSD